MNILVCVSRFYSFERESEHQWGAEGEGETDSLLSREPHTGLDSRTMGHDLSQRQTLN